MGELVALETKNTEEHKSNSEEDCIDFAAATTATLGVPSPCLSRARSFDDSPPPCPVSVDQKGRKGDWEEEAELLRALKLSAAELPTSADESLSGNIHESDRSVNSDESVHLKSNGSGFCADALEGDFGDERQIFHQPEPFISQDCIALSSGNDDVISSETISMENGYSSSKIDAGIHLEQLTNKESGENLISTDLIQNIRPNMLVQKQREPSFFLSKDSSAAYKHHIHGPEGDQQLQQACLLDTSTSEGHCETADNIDDCETVVSSGPPAPNTDSDVLSDRSQHTDVPKSVTSSLDGSEPIYEGEECILDSGPTIFENREPMYEGEMVLAEQADKGAGDGCDIPPEDEITQKEGKQLLYINEDDGISFSLVLDTTS